MSIEVWKDVAKDVYPFATWLHCISPRILKRQNSFFLKQLEAKKKEEATPAKANSQPFLHSFLILILHPSFIVAVFLNLCYSWKQQVLWLYIAMYILHQKGLDVIAKTLEYSTCSIRILSQYTQDFYWWHMHACYTYIYVTNAYMRQLLRSIVHKLEQIAFMQSKKGLYWLFVSLYTEYCLSASIWWGE